MKQLFVILTALVLSACGHQAWNRSNTTEGYSKGKSEVSYEFYRNATAKLKYNGKTLLLDPMLGAKHSIPSFAGIEPNPTIQLPVSINYILEGIDAVVVSHMHADHFDPAAAVALDKNIPIFTPDNASPLDLKNPVKSRTSFIDQLHNYGFTNVTTIGSKKSKSVKYAGITFTQEFAQHGTGVLVPLMGGVNGIIIQAEGQPTIYWTNDTILDKEGRIKAIVAKYSPDIVIAHTGGAVIKALSPDPLLMNETQAIELFKAAKMANRDVQIVAVHMNSLDHCFTTKSVLNSAIRAEGGDFGKNIIIPDEGEKVLFRAGKAL
ncbi:MBL fold metallo-hydrolase [Sansalvadorimonas verongulae]|uniref:MBL fold metallo-hydrolase n=1 Tax=Sansalvadorimonas verongulae TaxID=2172824 RepID=UPI0012BC9648|nr:MBL fold metallo-hydrolase [Sansalvadorimonas verongulae]